MRMRQLEAFRATIINGTISSAAKSLNTTQPTISRLLADLEYSLKLTLLHRRKGRVVPTEEGMIFYRKLDEVFEAFTKLKSTAEEISRDRKQELRIISLGALSISIVPEIMEEFTANHPEISITINTTDVKNYFNMIMDENLDIAFGNQMGEQPGVEQVILAKVDYVCALPPNHSLCEKDIVCEEDLVGEKLIALDSDDVLAFHQHTDLYKRINPITQFSTQHSANAYSLVNQGLCCGVLEPFSAKVWAASGVEIRPFKPKISYKYSAYYQETRKKNPLIRELVDIAARKFKKYEALLRFVE